MSKEEKEKGAREKYSRIIMVEEWEGRKRLGEKD